MKNRYRIITKTFLSLLIGITIASCSSVIDDTERDFGTGPVVVEFENTSASVTLIKTAEPQVIDYEIPITFFGGRGVALDKDVDITIAASDESTATEGVEYTLGSNTTFTIPAGSTSSSASIQVLTEGLEPFEFKEIILDIVSSSETVSDTKSTTITLRPIDEANLAGTYDVVDSDYWRIGVQSGSANWVGDHQVVIEALSRTTYKRLEYAGPFDGNEFFFSVEDNIVTVLTTNPETNEPIFLNDQPIITCISSPGNMTNVPCGADVTNFVERADDRTDIISMSYGYLADSGPREFFEVLQRVE